MITVLNGNKLEDPVILENISQSQYSINTISIQGDVTEVGTTFSNDGNIDLISTGIIIINE